MKKIFLTIVTVIANCAVYAQTGNTYPSSGNVGIGTTSPVAALDVVGGAIRITGGYGVSYSNPGTYIAFNTGTGGETNFINNIGGGGQGGFTFDGNNLTTTTISRLMTITNIGNVSIGTLTADAKFTVYQPIALGSSPKDFLLLSSVGGNTINHMVNNIYMVRNTAGNDWGTTRFHDAISVDGSFTSPQVNTRCWWERDADFDVQSWGTAANTYLTISQGNVGINTTDTKGYKFAVNGSAIATSMTVKPYSGWADYVFNPAYHLTKLADVKNYINKNHHLPDMPSEAEVAKNGIDLGEMNKTLVKKVEELTLYMIEKDKSETEQKEANRKQAIQLKRQQQQIDKLNQQLEYLIKVTQKR